jgi:hypothetical protein
MIFTHNQAAFMIARAASKLSEWTPAIGQFAEWLVENLETFGSDHE